MIQQKTLFKIEFDMRLKVSTNKIYSGIHYRTRKYHKEVYMVEVGRVLKKVDLPEIHHYPVILKFTCYYKSRMFDSSNGSYMAKMIEDLMVKNGVFKDDSPKYVSETRCLAKKGDKDKIVLEVLYERDIDENKRCCCAV